MSETLTIFGIRKQVEASTETRTTRYGTPSPTLTLKITGDVHYKVVNSVAHQVAARIELALLECGLACLVEIGYAEDRWEGRKRVGKQVAIRLELVGDEKRCPIAIESERGLEVLALVAERINSAPTK